MARAVCKWDKTVGYEYDRWKCTSSNTSSEVVHDRGRGSYMWTAYRYNPKFSIAMASREGTANTLAKAKAATNKAIKNMEAWSDMDAVDAMVKRVSKKR